MLNQRGFIPILVLLVVILLAGFVIYQKQTTSPASQPSEQPTSSDTTANWKTFNLSGFGVEFKLDPGYEILEEKPDLVSFYWINLGKEARIWVSNKLTKHPEVKCYEFDRPVDYNQNDFNTLCISDIEERIIDGVKVKVFSIHGGADYNYSYLQSENPQVEVKKYTSGGGAVKDFESIISTFKFVDNKTANWKTYENSSYGFSLLYPPDWVVTEDKTNIKLEEKLSNPLVKKEVQITIYENAGSLNAMEFLDKIFYKDYKEQEKLLKDSYLKNASLQPIIIGNKPATKIKELQTPPGSQGTGIWVTDKTIGILLRSYPVADGEKVFDQILSTFRFD